MMLLVAVVVPLALSFLWLYLCLPGYLARRARWSSKAFVSDRVPEACEEYAQRYAAWAEHHYFEYRGCFTVESLAGSVIGVYEHELYPVFFEIEMAGASAIWRFRSAFERDAVLTTTNYIDAVPPLRGERRQVFPAASLEELWAAHKRVHAQLVRGRRATHLEPAPAYRELVQKLAAREKTEVSKDGSFWLRLPLAYLEASKARDQPAA